MTRTPPYDQEAEASVLGAMLTSQDALATLSGIVQPEDFYPPRNQKVAAEVLRMFAGGEAIDPVTVADSLTRGKGADVAPVRAYVLELIEDFSTTGAALEAAKIVKEHATCRRLISSGSRIMDLGFSKPEDVEKAVAAAEYDILQVSQIRTAEGTQPLSNSLAADMEAIENDPRDVLGITTGFPSIDKRTHGFTPGQLVVIGGRSGHGKSSIMQRIGGHVAAQGKVVLFVSLEMMGKDIRYRLYAQEAYVPYDNIVTGRLNSEHWTNLSKASGRMSDWRLEINDKRGQTVAEIASAARRVKAKHGQLDLLIVDYLQRIQPDSDGNREQQVSKIAHDLSDLAGRLECPVITGSQLNELAMGRTDKRPRMGDLRESRGIDQASDVVLFAFWAWKHRNDFRDEVIGINEYELIVGKHRNGESEFVVDCDFEPERFLLTEKRQRVSA